MQVTLVRLDQAIEDMANAFLRWPLPESVCADGCATRQGKGRSGTNLMSVVETREMMREVVRPVVAQLILNVIEMAGKEHAERAEAEVERIKVSALGAIEAASKYSATGNYEEADLVRQDFAEAGTIEVFEKFRARANRTEKAEAELAKERARLDWLEKVDPTSPQWDIICDHVNIRAAIDAAMQEDGK